MGHTAMLDATRPDGQGIDHAAPSAQHAAPNGQHATPNGGQTAAPQQTASQHPDQALTPQRHLLAGATVAERLKLSPGQAIWLNGAQYLVEGVLQPTGSDDDSVMFADLGFAQAAFGQEGKVSFVEVAALCAGCPIEDIVRQLEEKLPDTEIQAMQSIVKQRMYAMHFVEHLILTVSLIILFIACCMVGATMLSSVNERVREIGLLRSLGFSRAGIFGVFCFEAVLIGLAAGVVGYFGGFFLSVEVLDLLGMAQEAEAAMHAGHLVLTCALIVGVSVLAAFFPSWKAASIEPSTALISL